MRPSSPRTPQPSDVVVTQDVAVVQALRHAYAHARGVNSGVELEAGDYEHGVLARVERRLSRAGITPRPAEVLRVCQVTCLDDLFLTLACELDARGAWQRLFDVYAPRIDGLARSLGLGVRNGSVGRDLLGDLARPPGGGDTRTRIGTFDGSGSLFAWLAVILRRRGATQARRRTAPAAAVERASLDARRATDDSDPFAALVDAEEGTRIVRALHAAWRGLATREQLALHFKYGESLKLKEIGALLGLSESGASRLVSGALDRLRSRVKPLVADGAIPPARLQLWAALWQAVGAEVGEQAP